MYDVRVDGDRSLTLRYYPQQGVPLAGSAEEVIKHVHRLWGFTVRIEQKNSDDSIELLQCCPDKAANLNE